MLRNEIMKWMAIGLITLFAAFGIKLLDMDFVSHADEAKSQALLKQEFNIKFDAFKESVDKRLDSVDRKLDILIKRR
jgi:hypothetical protein